MMNSSADERREHILRAAVRDRLVDPESAVLAAFVDLDGVAASVGALHKAFPDSVDVLHTFAAKANCLVPVLEEVRKLGMGCEVASAGSSRRHWPPASRRNGSSTTPPRRPAPAFARPLTWASRSTRTTSRNSPASTRSSRPAPPPPGQPPSPG